MYVELGGRSDYLQTPLRELQECRLSLIAEMNYQAEQEAELKRKQKEQERELERQRRGR
jgi:hypothetical protein